MLVDHVFNPSTARNKQRKGNLVFFIEKECFDDSYCYSKGASGLW